MLDYESLEKNDQSASDDDYFSMHSSDDDSKWLNTEYGEISYEDRTSAVAPCKPVIDEIKECMAKTACGECQRTWEAAKIVKALKLVDKFFDPERTQLRYEGVCLDTIAKVELSRQTLREVSAGCGKEACGKLCESIKALDSECAKALRNISETLKVKFCINTFPSTEVALKDGTLEKVSPSTLVECWTPCYGDGELLSWYEAPERTRSLPERLDLEKEDNDSVRSLDKRFLELKSRGPPAFQADFRAGYRKALESQSGEISNFNMVLARLGGWQVRKSS